MANPDAPRSPAASGMPSLTRRDVLRGMAGVAGIASVPALLAACGPGASPTTGGAAPSGGGSPAGGSITLGSNYSDAVPKKALQDAVDKFTSHSGITVKVNTVDHGTFQNQISSYLQGTPDDVWTWFSGFRMRFFAAQGLATDISDGCANVGSKYGEAFKGGSTGDDGQQYFTPLYLSPRAVSYRKRSFAAQGYRPPRPFDELETLAAQIHQE